MKIERIPHCKRRSIAGLASGLRNVCNGLDTYVRNLSSTDVNIN